jgi:hypothetical protein
MSPQRKAQLYKKYPWRNIFIYNGATALHFGLGGAGILLGYRFWGWIGSALGFAYLIFAFGEMYLLMPLKVCPNCVYRRLKGSLCISGMNVISSKLVKAGRASDFAKRAQGALCPNNLYLAALIFPILALIPALVFHFSWSLLLILGLVIGLLAFRFFIIFPKLACLHCHAKFVCPQAAMMGVRDL